MRRALWLPLFLAVAFLAGRGAGELLFAQQVDLHKPYDPIPINPPLADILGGTQGGYTLVTPDNVTVHLSGAIGDPARTLSAISGGAGINQLHGSVLAGPATGNVNSTLSTLGTPGTYSLVTTTAEGRVSAGAAAACTDITGTPAAGTACQANTGTSGHVLPFLDNNNTWSGAQTFGTVIGTVNLQSGVTSYTLLASDCGKTVQFDSASAITVTTLATIGVGCALAVEQLGIGLISIADGAGSSHHSVNGFNKTAGQWAILGLFVDANPGGSAATYNVTGDGQQ